jgi:hypothetical protein
MWVWAVAPDVHKVFQKTNEYPITFNFTEIADLNKNLRENDCSGQIDKLVIVSHGDVPGSLMFKPPLRGNANAVRSDLIHLRSFLKPGAMVIFIGCIAGALEPGDILFRQISAILAGCDIVSYALQNTVNDWSTGSWQVQRVGGSTKITRDDEWSEAAKWARNGAIVRSAAEETTTIQRTDPLKKLRCGSEHCIGHGNPGDVCNPYRRIIWPAWANVGASELEKQKPITPPQHHHHHASKH